MAHSQFLRIKKLTGASIILVAAKHNHREILAELGAQPGSSIDPSRVGLNYVLRGLDTAAGVADMAQALLDNAGVTSLRKDAVRSLEIVFSLPPTTTANYRDFFTDALVWADDYFGAPVISAVVHLDESAPHCHALVLPLVKGRMVGSDLMGSRAKLQSMQADFNSKVGVRYGLTHQAQPKRLSKALRQEAAVTILDAIKANHGRLNEPAVLHALVEALAENPEVVLAALGLSMPVRKAKAKSFVEIMTAPTKSKPIGFEQTKPIGFTGNKPIGFASAEMPEKSEPYHCVGFDISTLSNPLSNSHQTEQPANIDQAHVVDHDAAASMPVDEQDELDAPLPAPTSHRGQALDAVRAALHRTTAKQSKKVDSATPAKRATSSEQKPATKKSNRAKSKPAPAPGATGDASGMQDQHRGKASLH
jgi:hypothetical protein